MNEEKQEGDKCPDCDGLLGYGIPENCSCHINPPCNACVENPLKCFSCGWEQELEPIKCTSSVDKYWSKFVYDWEVARKLGYTFPNGGRIFDVKIDSRSGSTMEYSGYYEGNVTAKDILEYYGDGTFGHRGPELFGGRFSYTKITD